MNKNGLSKIQTVIIVALIIVVAVIVAFFVRAARPIALKREYPLQKRRAPHRPWKTWFPRRP